MIPSHAVTARSGRWTRPALTLLLLALAGCGKGGAGGGMGFKPPPMPVETAPVAQGRVADRFEAVGSIDASEAITVVSEIDGTVVRLPFHEGTTVDVPMNEEVVRFDRLAGQFLLHTMLLLKNMSHDTGGRRQNTTRSAFRLCPGAGV